MNERNVNPEKITKPIQLLAVWLIGLIMIESSLLTASGTITKPEWLAAFFGISAVCIIPLFLGLIFLLQTKFRPQMQGDEYYSKYLDKNTMRFIDIESNKKIANEYMTNEIIQILKETQDNLISIKATVDKGNGNEKLDSLLTISDLKIAELEKIVKLANVNIYINRTIKTFPDIIDAIKKIGFTKYEIFGEPPVPQDFLVSFTSKVSPLIIGNLLVELIPLGASYIDLVDEKESEEKNYGNAIFIGSYRYQATDKLAINQMILNKIAALNENSKMADLIEK